MTDEITVAPVLTVDKTAARSVLISLATGGLRVVGTALVAHGIATQGAVDSVIPAVAQDIAGTAIVLIGQFWSWLEKLAAHNKLLSAAAAEPSQIAIK